MAIKDNKYFIVGMPSSGKTTIGGLAAAQLGLKFFDLDHLISEKTGKTIAQIFEEDGEDQFRILEHQHLEAKASEPEGFVMATGGGAPCFFDNMSKMNAYGVTIYLDVTVEDLFDKLTKKGTQKRPLLKDVPQDELYNELKGKYETRKVFYEQSKIHLKQRFNDLSKRVYEVILAIQVLEE